MSAPQQPEELLQLQQQIVDAVASSSEGTYEATEFLLQTISHPAFDWIVQWLLTANPPFPLLSMGSSSRAFSLLMRGREAAAADAPAEQQQQRADFTAAAQIVGFNLLLQGIQENWQSGRWSDAQKQSLKRSVLSVVVSSQIAPAAELPLAEASAAAAAALAEASNSSGIYGIEGGQAASPAGFSSDSRCVPLQTHAARMKCAQVLNALCRHEWPHKWPGLLSCLKVKAASTVCAASPSSAQQQQLQQQTQSEAFAAACVLLGLFRELSQEVKEENTKSCFTLKRRLQIAQGIEDSVELVLHAISVILINFKQHTGAHQLQMLVAEVIREMAGVVDVALLLREHSVLLFLVNEMGGGGCFGECRLQVLQAFDALCSSLSKKKNKKLAIEAVNVADLAVFLHAIVLLTDAATGAAVNRRFQVDHEAFEIELSVAGIVKNLCETCADQLLKRVDCMTISLLWHAAVLPLLAHPSLRIATCGAAASTALIKRIPSAAATADHQQRIAQQQMLMLQQEVLLQQLPEQQQQQLKMLQQQALEQLEQKAFPSWFELRPYLSLLFLRCLRVGDPALVNYMADQNFTVLLDEFVIMLLAAADLPAACARAAAAAAAKLPAAAIRMRCVQSSLLQALAGTTESLQPFSPANAVKNWYQTVAEYAAAEDDLGTDALQGFAARFASMKSSSLVPVGLCFSMSPYAATRVTAELIALSQVALTHPLFSRRQYLPDVLLLLTQRQQQLKPPLTLQQQLVEKQHPWVCPGYILLDACCSFLEAIAQKLKAASLSAAAAAALASSSTTPPAASSQQQGDAAANSTQQTTAAFSACSPSDKKAEKKSNSPKGVVVAAFPGVCAAAVEWMLPAAHANLNAVPAPWAINAASLFSALMELRLFTVEDAAIATARVFGATTTTSTGDEAQANCETGSTQQSFCLYDFLLETRRLDLIASCAYLINFPQVKVDCVLELLFARILAETPHAPAPAAGAGPASTSSGYPLPLFQQIYLCRRRSLYTLMSICSTCPSTLSNYIPMMLQHVQNRLNKQQLPDVERNLLIESLVSLIAASQVFRVQQQHTLPLVRPYVEELRLVVSRLQQQDAAAATSAAAANSPMLPQQQVLTGVGLLHFLFGDLSTQKHARLSKAQEERLASQRRALARILSALDSCIKRTSVPADPTTARKGGYLESFESNSSNSAADAAASISQSFGESLALLLQQDPKKELQQQQQQQEKRLTLPRKHPLAPLMRDLLPLLSDLIEMYHHLWAPEMARAFPAYGSRLMLGEEEFLSLIGHTSQFTDPATLIESVALLFPIDASVEEAVSETSEANANAASHSGNDASAPVCSASSLTLTVPRNSRSSDSSRNTEQQLSTAGKLYANSPIRLVRRHCYHLRCILYRLIGGCCTIVDGFYVLPGLDQYLETICFRPIAFLPLQQLEQQVRLLWLPILDPANLPPQPPYPSQQLIMLFLNGVSMIMQRLHREWEAITQTRSLLLDNSSRSSQEEERELTAYTLHVEATVAVGESVLLLLKNLLHLSKTHHGAVSAAASTSAISRAAAVTEEDEEDEERSRAMGTTSRERGESATALASIATAAAGGAGPHGCCSSRNNAVEEDAGAAAAHLLEMRRAVYSNSAILTGALNAVLQVERWPVPASIIEAHNVLRTYVKSATKLFTSIPDCTAEICTLILRNVLESFFEKRSFDPFCFGESTQPSNLLFRGGFLQKQQHRQQQMTGSTPLQEFLSGNGVSAVRAHSAEAYTNTQLSTYTTTVYQILRALCRILTAKITTTGNRILQPSSLLLCPSALTAFNFFRTAGLPVQLNEEDFERFVEAVMLKDCKEGKAFVREFLQRNYISMQQGEGHQPAVQFVIKELRTKSSTSAVPKSQTNASCELSCTFLSAAFQ